MAKINLNKELIRELSELLDETGLCEIEISEGRQSVRVSRRGESNISSFRTEVPATQNNNPPAPNPHKIEENAEENLTGVVTSPMVGTVYLSPKPNDPAFVKEGDSVSEGQSIMIIEAMKVMNPIPAPHSGKVTKILVTDTQSVEFGEPLLVIE
ncbi:MAG: acetyl-CoA carboxylase biotin carboxyl carrier protein [Pseudomonadota bacterium]|nr:acetyl-CoA carboxylase biotin carboxyl carrier protein [Pseudomonadota bacterium]